MTPNQSQHTASDKPLADKASGQDATLRIGSGDLKLLVEERRGGTSIDQQTLHTYGYDKAVGIESLSELFYSTELLRQPFRSTTIYLDNGDSYVLAPSDLREEGSDPLIWLQLAQATEGHQVLSTPLESIRATLIWSVPQELYDFCLRSFPMANFIHPIAPLISACTTYTRREHPHALMVYWVGSSLDVLYSSEGALQLANRYEASSAVDALYYITALWRQLDLSTPDDHLLLYTQSEEGAEQSRAADLLKLLQESITNIYHQTYPGVADGLLASMPPEMLLSRI
ncbi:MAG: DUF3822 family protein [Porphyromonas sp.]|nr:DUF3822 family protein [Porphyromonas sp.]